MYKSCPHVYFWNERILSINKNIFNLVHDTVQKLNIPYESYINNTVYINVKKKKGYLKDWTDALGKFL